MACSPYSSPKWVNQTLIICKLPFTSPTPAPKIIINCESKVLNEILAQLTQNRLKLVHFFLGNWPILASLTEQSDHLFQESRLLILAHLFFKVRIYDLVKIRVIKDHLNFFSIKGK